MVINQSGNVGIGTTSPLARLGIVGADALNTSFAANIGGSTGTGLVVTNAGNVGVGTTTPVQKLQVAGDIRIGTGTTGCVEDADGTVLTGSCSSDVRLKENITPLSGSLLDQITGIDIVTYNWRASEYPDKHWGSETQLGVVAQQVEENLPQLVVVGDDGFKKVRFQDIPLYTLQGLKELKTRVESDGSITTGNETKLNALSQKIAQVEAQIDQINHRLGLAKIDLTQGAQAPQSGQDLMRLTVEKEVADQSQDLDVGTVVSSNSEDKLILADETLVKETLGIVVESTQSAGVKKALVATLGSAEAFVSSSSAQIAKGDFVSVATESGKLKKAEMGEFTVGKALENWTNSTNLTNETNSTNLSNSSNSIRITVLPGYYQTSGSLISISEDLEAVKIDKNTDIYKDLNVLGRTTLSDLYLTGRANFGFLVIDGFGGEACRAERLASSELNAERSTLNANCGASISTLGTDLYLQNSPLSGNLDLFDGKVVITNNGDLTTIGTLTAKKIRTNELTVGKVLVATDSAELMADSVQRTASSSAEATPSAERLTLNARPNPTI